MPQVKFSIDTSFSENKRAGVGVKYLNCGEIPPRIGTELAISCLLAPVGYAVFGGSLEEVDAQIEISRSIFESYMSLARNRAESILESIQKKGESKTNNSPLTKSIKLEDKFEIAPLPQEQSSEEVLTEINFDDEEF